MEVQRWQESDDEQMKSIGSVEQVPCANLIHGRRQK